MLWMTAWVPMRASGARTGADAWFLCGSCVSTLRSHSGSPHPFIKWKKLSLSSFCVPSKNILALFLRVSGHILALLKIDIVLYILIWDIILKVTEAGEMAQ